MRVRRVLWGLSVGLALLSIWAPGAAAPDELPPRPTAEPGEPSPPPRGANVALHAYFPGSWDFHAIHWETPWTAVEWQDGEGNWHTVEGWQGNFDHALPEGDRHFGLKTWWVAPRDLGTGPFRWVVYAEGGGAYLARSEAFALPATLGGQRTVDVTMTVP